MLASVAENVLLLATIGPAIDKEGTAIAPTVNKAAANARSVWDAKFMLAN
jgi:hypothetical protein